MGFFTKNGDKDKFKKAYTKDPKVLGSGNFAKVYKATVREKREVETPTGGTETLMPGTTVAIKEIDKAKVEDMGDIEREIEVMKKINHTNVIRLYEIFEESKKTNLVMELVTGGELFDEIVNRGQYTEKDAAFVMGTLCNALDYLHKLRIVHRDLKPENILLAEKPSPGKEPQIKVADFGLARLISDKDMMKTACGTPGYVAPEVLKNKGYDSGAVDLWSAGVILYILLCGFPPFYEEELPALFDQILKARYDFPSPWWDQISGGKGKGDGAKDLVRSCLVVDPVKRYTAAQVLAHPWIKGNAPDTAIDLNNLRKFQATRKLKAAAAKIMAMKNKSNLASLAIAAKAQEDAK